MEFKRFKSENPVWGYFQRSTNGDRAKCETCGTSGVRRIFPSGGPSFVTIMWRHTSTLGEVPKTRPP